MMKQRRCLAKDLLSRSTHKGNAEIMNCWKLTNKVVNRIFVLFVNNSTNLSFITQLKGEKKSEGKTTGKCFSNRKLLDNLVIVEMVVSSSLLCDIYAWSIIMKRYFFIRTQRLLSAPLWWNIDNRRVEYKKCSFEFNFSVIKRGKHYSNPRRMFTTESCCATF